LIFDNNYERSTEKLDLFFKMILYFSYSRWHYTIRNSGTVLVVLRFNDSINVIYIEDVRYIYLSPNRRWVSCSDNVVNSLMLNLVLKGVERLKNWSVSTNDN